MHLFGFPGSHLIRGGQVAVALIFVLPLVIGSLLRHWFGMASQEDAGNGEGSGTDSAIGEVLGLKAWAELKADTKSPCDPCEIYVELLVASVEERLVILLQGGPAVGGINLKGTLQQQEPLTIDATGQLQTTKEHWRWENCRNS